MFRCRTARVPDPKQTKNPPIIKIAKLLKEVNASGLNSFSGK